MNKDKCKFCNDTATNKGVNDFYVSCDFHKELAQIEAEKFFRANPDYSKWSIL